MGPILLTCLRRSAAHCLQHSAGLKIMVTGGASGRLGQRIVAQLKNSYPVIITSSKAKAGTVHLPLNLSVTTMMSKIKDAGLVIHSGCRSNGSPEDIHDTNVEGTKRLIDACKASNIPMLYLSSTAATLDGLSQQKTPYAHSKKEAEKYAIENGIPVARIGALVGDEDTNVTSVCHMAGIAKIPSVSIRTPDKDIQPIDYDSAALGVTRIAEMMIADNTFQEVIDVVGDSISLHQFLDLVNNFSVPVYVDPEDLENVAALINDGALTPEFVELSKKDCKPVDNGRLKEILGSDYKPASQIAIEARKEINLKKVTAIGRKIFMKKSTAEQKEILKAVLKLIRSSKSVDQAN